MKKEKIKQVFCLITCIMVIIAVAINRDHKVLGHDLTTQATINSKTTKVDTMRTEPDGTIVINTTELGKDIKGYGGRVPLEIYLKESRIIKVKALKNSETPDFFAEASQLLTRWNGKTSDEALAMKIDGISGATFSSRGIIKNMQCGLQYAQKNASEPSFWERIDWSAKSLIGLIVVLAGAILPLFWKNKRYRTVQMLLNITILGLWCGTFISYSLIVNYMSAGIDPWTALVPIVMLITAFIYPLFGKKNYYCNNICPCGALQDLAGKARKKKWKMSSQPVKLWGNLRQLFWSILMVLMLAGVLFQWMDYEIFTAFIFRSASVVVLILAGIVTMLSVFVPRPYCRFICPTGTLFKIAQGGK